MFKIEIRENSKKLKEIVFSKPITIESLLQKEKMKLKERIGYKLNGVQFVNGNFELSSDSVVDIINFKSLEGYRIFQDSAVFILTKAFQNVFKKSAKMIVEHSIGDGIFCEVFHHDKLVQADIDKLKAEMQRIINNDLPIEKQILEEREAEDIFYELGRKDLLTYFKYVPKGIKIQIYRCGRFYDQFIRQLADRTSSIVNFDIKLKEPGFILQLPNRETGVLSNDCKFPEKLFEMNQEHDKWLNILKIHNVSTLNKINQTGRLINMIQVEEALHENKITKIVDKIVSKNNAKIVLIAGPSSSGKTTFAKRLGIQMQVAGLLPIIIGMDDYFLPRTKTPKKEDGSFDFESIHSLDLKLLNSDLNKLLDGKEIEQPKYNFVKVIQERSGKKLILGKNKIVIMEGIHGLNEELTKEIEKKFKFKIYISAINQLNIDDHNRIPTTDNRLIRRIVRDKNFRGYSAEETLERWYDVRVGEEQNIFPFQENADEMFNSGLTYELAILKQYALRYLENVSKYSPMYLEAQRLILLLQHFEPIEESLVPKNSIIKEFIGSSAFEY
ncbi:MAG: nucleoside kinase [Candidatus Cloacimonadota bacterium]|nr:nucleoside kinase [Candidatus Cloacimonadota bacterium]